MTISEELKACRHALENLLPSDFLNDDLSNILDDLSNTLDVVAARRKELLQLAELTRNYEAAGRALNIAHHDQHQKCVLFTEALEAYRTRYPEYEVA